MKKTIRVQGARTLGKGRERHDCMLNEKKVLLRKVPVSKKDIRAGGIRNHHTPPTPDTDDILSAKKKEKFSGSYIREKEEIQERLSSKFGHNGRTDRTGSGKNEGDERPRGTILL